MSDLPTPTERIVDEAAAAAEASQDLRAAVRDLTLRALEHRALDLGQLRQVFSAVTEGVSLGLARRGGEIKDAASDALAGLTDAAQKAAEATRLAAEQLLAEGKALTDEDLKPVVDDLRRLEQELLDAVSRGSERAAERVRQAFSDLLTHARRAGTDTGRIVAETVESLTNRTTPALRAGVNQGAAAAGEFARRLALVASGVLAGLSEALHGKAGGQKGD